MAYTASALSFMLENLGKTVVLTGIYYHQIIVHAYVIKRYYHIGSQVSIVELVNDARKNLITSMV